MSDVVARGGRAFAAIFIAVLTVAGCGGGGSGSNTSCTSTCSTAGSTKCSGTQVQTCQTGGDGCLAWSTAAACPGTGLCSVSENACVADPCNGVPTSGICATSTSVSYCGVPTGEGVPRTLTYACAAGEGCQVQAGKAKCVVTAACRDAQTECQDASTLRTCSAGTWSTSTCTTSCRTTTLGSLCVAPGTLTTLTGRVLFEARAPNAGLTDWESSPSSYIAPLFLVLSRGAGGVYDAVYTDANGQFSIQVPASPVGTDAIVVAAAASNDVGGLAFAVANPGFSSGGTKEIATVGTPALWSWAWLTSGLTDGQDLTITEAMGSGAANVYFNLVGAYVTAYGQYATLGPSLIAWIGMGSTWTCGACFAAFPTTVFGLPFASQVWLGGDATDASYWSDAVNQHEMGHWAMASFGVSPGEGGQHFLGKPTFPGQAWSEGWATWFSSAVRGDPLYYDKQGGSFFWLDISAAQYGAGSTFVQPVAADGLLQRLDENEVSAMMWSLSSSGAVAESAVYQALVAPRMVDPTATRGYTRHTWAFDGSHNFIDVVDTGQAAPCFADFLDALDCDGFSRSAIDAATVPATQFPYPSAAPICN